jgi:hypothetical protein
VFPLWRGSANGVRLRGSEEEDAGAVCGVNKVLQGSVVLVEETARRFRGCSRRAMLRWLEKIWQVARRGVRAPIASRGGVA